MSDEATKRYNDSFYISRHRETLPMARIIVPIVIDQIGDVSSVCDLGCGVGTFLSVFSQLGAKTVLGVEGDWVDKKYFVLGSDRLVVADLSKKLPVVGRFDLSMSLEVAEHIPIASADVFVDNLTALSNNILFSAAVPGQGGVNHVNEQPHEYWIEKFNARGFVLRDCIRSKIANIPSIFPWYRNNIMMFIK